MKRSKHSGFTLMEMMIVVAIIAIISAVAYPSFRDSGRRGHRSDARSALLENAQYMERFFTENSAYNLTAGGASPTLPRTVSPANATGGNINYNISLSAVTATSFTLQAVPVNGMAADVCPTLTLNNLGQKSVSGTLSGGMTADSCWER